MKFEKLFRDYKVDFNTRVNKGWANVTCPFCDDKTYNGGFEIEAPHYHCWKCGSHSLTKALSLVLRIPESEIPQILKDYGGTDIQYKVGRKKQAGVEFLRLPSDCFTDKERKYLQDRNFDPDYLNKKYGVVGGGIAGSWSFRIIIPLFYNGQLVSWTGRSILSKEKLKELEIPRYKNLAIEKSVKDPKSVLFNLDNANSKEVVLLEGPFDVMRFGDDSICSFGTELTQSQLKEISERFKKVYILFDSEIEAQQKAHKFGLQLSVMGVHVEVLDMGENFGDRDLGELTQEEVKWIRKELRFKY